MARKKEIKIHLDKPTNTCFVVMPFSNTFKSEYEKVIIPAIEENDIKCVRGDEIYSKQRIMDDIWNSLRNCKIVVAELTGKNPNVMYEVGLAHAIGKPVIIITRNEQDVPFDLKDLRYLYYDTNDPFWGDNLKKGLSNLIKRVLKSPTINKYLENIDVPKAIEYKDLVIEKEAKSPLDLQNIAGSWEGYFDTGSDDRHDVVLHLIIDDLEISGSATVSFKNEKLTVVQQTIKGTISDELILIEGVNYTYIEQGDSSGYNLDIFEVKFIDKKLSGFAFDNNREGKFEIEFKKSKKR